VASVVSGKRSVVGELKYTVQRLITAHKDRLSVGLIHTAE